MKRPARERAKTALDIAREEYVRARTMAQWTYEKACTKAMSSFRRAIAPSYRRYKGEFEKLQQVLFKEVRS